MIRPFHFMGKRIHPSALPPGVLYIGEPGSGKTATLLTHIKSLTKMGINLIGIDLKGDLPPFMQSYLPENVPIHVIDPFHMDGTRIDWAAMMKTQVGVDAFVKKMIPEIKGDAQPHFRNSAVLSVKRAAEILNHYAKSDWHLADLIRLAKNRPLLVHLNNQNPNVFPRIQVDREDNTSHKDVQSTVETALSLFEIYAALELRCTKKVNPYSVLDLGHGHIIFLWSDEFESVLSSIASFLIDSVTKRLLSRQADDDQLTLLWLDELTSLQKIDALDAISKRGRSSKIIPLIGVQTYEGVRHIYGPDLAEQMLGNLPYKIVFRVGTVTTAKWASEYLGIPRTFEIVRNFHLENPYNTSVKDNHPVVTPEELRRIPKPNLDKEDVIHGYVDFPDGAAPFEIDVLSEIQYPKGGQKPKKRVPDDWQKLPPFKAEDLLRLKFPNCLNLI